MTATFAESLAALSAQWAVLIRIEGSGTGSTLYTYCSTVPAYGDSTYRPWLTEWPTIGPERVDPLGGLPSSGELGISLADIGDALTSEWRIEADPDTYLGSASAASDTSVLLASATGVTAGSVLYVGNEALLVTSIAGAPTVVVTRGGLDTDATPHEAGCPVYLHLPYLHGRRMRLSIVPADASSSAQEREVGSYRIDEVELSDNLGAWVIRGTSQMRWLGRLAMRRPAARFSTVAVRGEDSTVTVRAHGSSGDVYGTITGAQWTTPAGRFLLRNARTEEIFSASLNSSSPSLTVWVHGLYGTTPANIEPDDVLTLVYGAAPVDDIDYPTSFFRWSESSSSSRNASWVASCHFIDLILNLAVSSAVSQDGLELANRNATYGAWDCLPVGVGIGVPHAQIDWAAWLAVRSRTPDYLFPGFFVGEEPIPFADLITDAFLRPLGAYLSTANGLARIILPRIPLVGSATLTLGTADILSREVGLHQYEHQIRVRKGRSTLAPTLVYTLAREANLTVSNADYRGTYGQAGYYGTDNETTEIDARFVALDRDGSAGFLEQSGQSRILRSYRPPWELELSRDWAGHGVYVGDLVALTYPDLPDLSAGARDWTAVACELGQTQLAVDAETGLRYDWTLRSFGPNLRVGSIAPCARIVSAVAGAGAEMVVTVAANRYTQSDALGGLPTSDAAAFAVGDVLRLCNPDGTDDTPSDPATVVSVGTNTITLDGDFTGHLDVGTATAGFILRYSPTTYAAAQQTNTRVYWVEGSAIDPWKYGEP